MDVIDFDTIPARALNCSSRLKLSTHLNPERVILSSDTFARDYRGLAEQMHYSFADIRNFQRKEDPTMKFLEEWTARSDATFGKLIQFLENMGRYDVIEDLQLHFENDARVYLQYIESALQVPEVTSCSTQSVQMDDLVDVICEDKLTTVASSSSQTAQINDRNFFACEDTFTKDATLNMDLKEKRARYHCTNSYVTLDDIPTWNEYSKNLKTPPRFTGYNKDERLNNRVSIFVGDITFLEIDAIVNAANRTLLGGGGADGAIHEAAGKALLDECIDLNGCKMGEAKITGGYELPAKYVIHTVGPIELKPMILKNCYLNSLNLAKERGLKSIAFPCIATGVHGYPKEDAAKVALETVREFLKNNESVMERVIFCLFLPIDVKIYESLMHWYFPS